MAAPPAYYFLEYINWKIFWYYVPAAAWLFKEFSIAWLQLLVGLFLVNTIFQYKFGRKHRSFPMQLWYFTPLGFLVSVLGTLIGAFGPVLNPFYLNIGLDKEELIARFLSKMKSRTCRILLIILLVISGFILISKQSRNFL